MFCLQQPYTAVAAEPAWLRATDLSVGSEDAVQGAGNPEIAVNDRGDAVAVWWRDDGTNWRIQAATRSAKSYYWSMPVNLSQGESGKNESAPQVALDNAGNAVVVWVSRAAPGSATAIEAAARPAGRPWSQATQLATAQAPQWVGSPQLAIDKAGETVAVWELDDDSNSSSVVQAASRSAGGEWSGLPDLSAPEQNVSNSHPQVAVDGDGNALAVWTHVDEELRSSIQDAVRPAGSGWSQPVGIYTADAGQYAQIPQVAVSDGGEAAAVWELDDYSNSSSIVQAAFRSVDTGWSEPTPISDAAQSATEPQVAVSDNSDAVAVWESGDSNVQSAVRPAAGDWSAPVPISRTKVNQVAWGPHVAIDEGGDVVAVWDLWSSPNYEVQAAVMPAGGNWSDPTSVSVAGQDGSEPQVASDNAGNAAATWTSKACDNDGNCTFTIRAAGLDSSGPILDAPSVPQSGVAGSQLEFSISPFDIWSSVGETSWDFGDGQSAAGTTVSHAYSEPGTYQVRVSAADSLGHLSAQSFSIEIAAQQSGAETLTSHPIAAQAAALSGLSMRIRCGKRGKRLLPCRRNVGGARKLVMRFAANAQTKVLVEVTLMRDRRNDRVLIRRVASARAGVNRFVLPLGASGGGRLLAKLSVVQDTGTQTFSLRLVSKLPRHTS